MAPYYLILLLLTGFTSFGWVSHPSQRLIDSVQKSKSNPSVANVILAQDSPNTEPLPESQSEPTSSQFSFPVGMVLLAIGGLTITGSAVFILMRLLNKVEQDSEVVENPSSTLPTPGETDSTLINPPTTLQQPARSSMSPSSPASISEVQPESTSTLSSVDIPFNPDQNPYLNKAEPVDTPKSTLETTGVQDQPRYEKIDPVEQLILSLRHSHPTHRSKAIWELGQQGDSRAIQPLVDLLLSSDSKQRSLILASLSEISVRTLKPMNRALSLSLQDENAEVRKNAIRDLSRIYDLITQMSQVLQRAIDDPDPEVEEAAQWAINKLARIRPTLPNSENLDGKPRRQGKPGRKVKSTNDE